MSLSAASRHPVGQTIKTLLRVQPLWMRMQWSRTITALTLVCVSTYWCHTNSVTQSSDNRWNVSLILFTLFFRSPRSVVTPLLSEVIPFTLSVEPSCVSLFITLGSLQSYQKNRSLPPALCRFSYPWHHTYRLTSSLPHTLNPSPFPHSYSSAGNLTPSLLTLLME